MKRLALATCLLSAATAAAYGYLPFRMLSSQAHPFPYYQDNRVAAPANLAVSRVEPEVNAAWNRWNGVTCALPKGHYEGMSSGIVADPSDIYDDKNVTPVWVTSGSSSAYRDIITSNYVAAITIPVSYSGVLNTCDTFLNAVDYQWSVDATTPATFLDVQTVMGHEIGHCLGLDHNGDENDIMHRSVTPGENFRFLGSNDTQSLCDRNPAHGAQYSPCDADGGCGGVLGLRCITQQLPTSTATYCTAGCLENAGTTNCTVPLSCQTSTLIPTFTSACLLPVGAITPVGKPCNNQSECQSPQSTCIRPTPAPSGANIWEGGYCTQSCAAGRGPCPVGSACTTFSDGTVQCLKSCRVGQADCRADYACEQSTNGGVCIPRCYNDNDCGNPSLYACRTCDGLCVEKQTPTAQIGDVCSSDSECGAGQVCLALDPRSPTKLCTEQCGRGCAACKPGSSCHAMQSGDLYCIKDCTGVGTCGSGRQCSTLSGGKGCMPACNQQSDCPVGLSCSSAGECVEPGMQMCDLLCQQADSGMIINPKPKDAGSGGGGPGIGGCGCAAADGDAMLLWFAGMGVLFVVRRMRWLQR